MVLPDTADYKELCAAARAAGSTTTEFLLLGIFQKLDELASIGQRVLDGNAEI